MEITNEIKAKVFAQYLGQQLNLKGIQKSQQRFFKCTTSTIQHVMSNQIDYEGCTLTLKQLSAITDEDSLEVSDILKNLNTAYAHTFDKRPENIKKYPLTYATKHIHTCQFLQSKGYDLPQYLLGGKTLQEAGLAIYE